MDVDVLDRDFLLPLAAITLECLDLHCKRSQQLGGEVAVPVLLRDRLRALQPCKTLIAAKCVATICVARHALDFVASPNAAHRRQHLIDILFSRRARRTAITSGINDIPKRIRVGKTRLSRPERGHEACEFLGLDIYIERLSSSRFQRKHWRLPLPLVIRLRRRWKGGAAVCSRLAHLLSVPLPDQPADLVFLT
jgi:hypothetical protein